MAAYEVAIKGSFKRKRQILGSVETQDKESALKSLGWSYLDERLGRKYYTNKDGDLVAIDDISIRKV